MWKTVDVETSGCYLCPECDSLGPHLAWHDEDADQRGLDCIDCGAPLGLEPLDDEGWADSGVAEGTALWTRVS